MPTSSPITVCTLWEGDYHKGLAALANSLIVAGYKGTIWAGYRGDLPEWARSAEASHDVYHHTLTPAVSIAFVPFVARQHLALCKPRFMAEVLDVHAPNTDGVYYFDPDVFVIAEWSFFEQWVESGVAVCEDYANPVNPTHPRVSTWRAFAEDCGLAIHNPAKAYLNSGLLGLKRQDATVFLKQWALLLCHAEKQYGFTDVLQLDTRTHPFHSTDQDALNIVTMTFLGVISRIGSDGMAFSHGEWLTVHAIMFKKPWRRLVFLDWLKRGQGIERGLRHYWRFADGPASAEPAYRIRLHKFLVPFVAFLSRFYRRH